MLVLPSRTPLAQLACRLRDFYGRRCAVDGAAVIRFTPEEIAANDEIPTWEYCARCWQTKRQHHADGFMFCPYESAGEARGRLYEISHAADLMSERMRVRGRDLPNVDDALSLLDCARELVEFVRGKS